MFEFLTAGGPFMYLLVLTSVVAIAFVLERGWALRWSRVVPSPLEGAVEDCKTRADLPMLELACRQFPSTLGRLLLLITRGGSRSREEMTDALETRARHEVVQLERGLIVLEVVVGIAPLLGLLGTIHGLITLFAGLASGPMDNNELLARGISIALYTTMAGLVISIPCLIAWSYYTRKVEMLAVEMETICDELVQRLHRQPAGDSVDHEVHHS